MNSLSQTIIDRPGPLLKPDGSLTAVGWSRQPLLDCNLENTRTTALSFLQRFRIKRWDYYGITTPTHFFSFTLSDLGYLGMVFAYVIDFSTKEYHEETLTLPLAKGVVIPRNSTEGESRFYNKKARMNFSFQPGGRQLSIDWPKFNGSGLRAEIDVLLPEAHESMVIVIPIKGNRFYYNRKINCMPVQGLIEYQGRQFKLDPQTCLANLDWGRGVWEYRSFWVWASASGFLPDQRTIGLNLGFGFGDTSAATENAFILNGSVHKLGAVEFNYTSADFMRPWTMKSNDGRLDLVFTPFFERVAKTDLKVLGSEVHQMFGRYQGKAVTDEGEELVINGLHGWAEEHHAKW